VKARLTAYVGVQLRDFLLGRVPLLVVVAGLATWALFRVTGVTLAAFDPSAGIGGRQQAQHAFEDALGVYALFGAVFAAQGLVAHDRWRGFDRVLFSRPLIPARYYLQGFVVAGVAIVGVGVVAAGVFAVAVRPVSIPGVATYIGLAWFTVGALALALSTLTAYHLPILLGFLGAAGLLERFVAKLRTAGTPSPIVEAAQYLLPPVHVIAALREPFARGRVVGFESLAWPLAFGLVSMFLAVFLLYRRPFRS
jgi:hypothetical protein